MTQSFPFDAFFQNQTENTSNFSDLDGKAPDSKPLGQKNTDTKAPVSGENLLEIKAKICQYLENNVPKPQFNTYFKDSFNFKGLCDGKVIFTCPTSYIKLMLLEQHHNKIREAIFFAMEAEIEFLIEVQETANSSLSSNTKNIFRSLSESKDFNIKESDEKSGKNKSANDIKFTLNLNPTKDDLISEVESKYLNHVKADNGGILIDNSKTFDNFVVGSSNNMAFATAVAIGKDPSRPSKPGRYPSLYIHSDSGLGKTHLLHAIANQIKQSFPNLIVYLVTTRDFMKEMISAMQDNTLSEFQKKYSEIIDVLMIDDIHELKNKSATQNEFFHIFNELHNKGKQLIFTSDKLPTEIDGIAERIRTRLQWGLLVDIQKPDFETRLAILKRKALELDLFLNDTILTLIANHYKNSIRELEGSLIRLSAYSDVMKIELDPEMVKDLLMLRDSASIKQEITIDRITKQVANYFMLQMADIKSKTRTQSVTKARHISMYLSQKHLKITLQEIGDYFGGKDHTSVIHATKKISKNLKLDAMLQSEIIDIESKIF